MRALFGSWAAQTELFVKSIHLGGGGGRKPARFWTQSVGVPTIWGSQVASNFAETLGLHFFRPFQDLALPGLHHREVLPQLGYRTGWFDLCRLRAAMRCRVHEAGGQIWIHMSSSSMIHVSSGGQLCSLPENTSNAVSEQLGTHVFFCELPAGWEAM